MSLMNENSKPEATIIFTINSAEISPFSVLLLSVEQTSPLIGLRFQQPGMTFQTHLNNYSIGHTWEVQTLRLPIALKDS